MCKIVDRLKGSNEREERERQRKPAPCPNMIGLRGADVHNNIRGQGQWSELWGANEPGSLRVGGCAAANVPAHYQVISVWITC